MLKLVMAIIINTITASYACEINGQSGFMPENNLKIEIGDKSANDMTEERFNEIIDLADKHYAPIVKSNGGKLKWSRKWNDGTVNASAQRMFKTWRVNMYGGLARHELVTADAFAPSRGHASNSCPKRGRSLRECGRTALFGAPPLAGLVA